MAAEQRMDSSSPLFINSSDVPGVALVSTPFDGSGFGGWRRSILIALSAKNKIGFVDGTCIKPTGNLNLLRQWNRCNDMVISWIINSLSKEIADSVLYSETACDIWKELNDMYGQANGARWFQVQKDLNNLDQGNNDVAGFYTRIKKLWDEVATLNIIPECVCNCTCGAKEGLQRFKEDQKLLQFLMGLNDSYSHTRGNILMMSPLPSVAKAYSILVHEERQREVSAHTQILSDSASFNVSANNQRIWNSGGGYNQRTWNSGGGNNQRNVNQGPGPSRGNTSQRGVNFRKPTVICKYCKKQGHSVENCYKLVGYPPNFKGNTNRGGVVANQVIGEDAMGYTMPALTKEQYEQLLKMLNQPQTQVQQVEEDSPECSANFAGPFTEEASGVW